MSLYNHKDAVVEAEQFFVDVVPWPKGVEESESICEPFYSIMTPDGDQLINDGDFIIYSGDVSPEVVECEVFMKDYTPVPDDVYHDDVEPSTAMADALREAGVETEVPQEGIARPASVRMSGKVSS